jgi:hypothetical protein
LWTRVKVTDLLFFIVRASFPTVKRLDEAPEALLYTLTTSNTAFSKLRPLENFAVDGAFL